MNALITKNWDLMVQPVSAFVTFTTQEAKERCVRYFYEKDPNSGEINTSKIDGGFTSLGVALKV